MCNKLKNSCLDTLLVLKYVVIKRSYCQGVFELIKIKTRKEIYKNVRCKKRL